ncbi:hypothetical protein P9112_013321 [Eukaryota sp. TZLM1-RC]
MYSTVPCCSVCIHRTKSSHFLPFEPVKDDMSYICHLCHNLLSTSNNILLESLPSMTSLASQYSCPDIAIHLTPSITLRLVDLLYAKIHSTQPLAPHKDALRIIFSTQIASILNKPVSTSSNLAISVQVDTPEFDEVVRKELGFGNRKRRSSRRRNSKEGNEKPLVTQAEILKFVEEKVTFEQAKILISKFSPTQPCKIKFELNHNPLYLFGYYQKLIRNLPQTPFPGYPTDLSTIAISPLITLIDCDSFRFEASGREDIDVRCLEGRPFVATLYNPKRANIGIDDVIMTCNLLDPEVVKLSQLELTLCGDQLRNFVKFAEGNKSKKYTCLVHVDGQNFQKGDQTYVKFLEKIVSLQGQSFDIEQETPLRVLHRRTLMTRHRHVSIDKIEIISKFWFVLDLTTTAGTYVKEFIHSDLGRTRPSLAFLLGIQCEIAQLDVLSLVI